MNYYIFNEETQKLELHFKKEDYMALSEELKKEIHSNFLFSRKSNAWVSRAKFPNLWRAEEIAKKLGLADGGKVGKTLSFAEQMERKAERAEARAARYDEKSVKAVERAEILQKPISDMHGDIAFFTQPNINTSAGRAFARRREKMWDAWERGYEEFKKSEYFEERAAIARETAKQTKPTDKGFIIRRINDAEKTIRAQKKNLESYYSKLERIEQGEIIKRIGSGNVITAEEVQNWIQEAELIIENAISKAIYYHDCLEEVGGVEFSQENIKVGFIVDLDRWGKCKVTGTGKVNIAYEILTGGAAGMCGKANYAEIKSISSTEIQIEPHPFKVGEVYTIKVWWESQYIDKEYTVIKINDEKVTLKSGTDRAITRKARKIRDRSSENGYTWALDIVNGMYGTIYKRDEKKNIE